MKLFWRIVSPTTLKSEKRDKVSRIYCAMNVSLKILSAISTTLPHFAKTNQ